MYSKNSENFSSGYEDERQALVSWVLINFSSKERHRVIKIFFENFDLSFKDALRNIHGKSVLIFVVQVILTEPNLDDLPEFGYSAQQIDEWALLRRNAIQSIICFPEKNIPELKTFLSDGMNIYDSVICALRV